MPEGIEIFPHPADLEQIHLAIKEPQVQGILQGFRLVGSGSKLGRDYPVTAYRLGGRVTIEKMLEFIPDSNGEQQQLLGLMRKGRLSMEEAKVRSTRIGMSGGSSKRSGGAARR